ncbi:MAG: sprT domain-containing protein [Hyphomicrobiales bacterium]|nr:MAG: sprT domain-containing protein [Hyphomicrobiales bacterium]
MTNSDKSEKEVKSVFSFDSLSSNEFSSVVRSNSQDQNLTIEAYADLYAAMDFFNDRLFGGNLPDCILTFTRHKNILGYFCGERFESRSGIIAHEIAMNPIYMQSRGDAEALSTLLHEMCHLWRHALAPLNRGGGKGANGYHDLVWVKKMEEVGLLPTSTGLPGGKKTGYSVTHIIIEGGQFDLDCKELLASGFKINWCDRLLPQSDDQSEEDDDETAPPKKKKDRVKFTCDECGLNAWAKPSAPLVCGSCGIAMNEAA